jgi:lysophospholipase L1-like esterase
MDGEINCVGWGPQPSLVLYNRGDETDKFAYGHYTLRNDITREWNNVLEHKCNIHGIPFVSLFDELINDDNTAKREFYTDDCHLNSKALWNIVNQKFKDKGVV